MVRHFDGTYYTNSIVGYHLFYFKESLFYLGPTWKAFQRPSADWLFSYKSKIKARTLHILIDLELFKAWVREERISFLGTEKLSSQTNTFEICKGLFNLRMSVGKFYVFLRCKMKMCRWFVRAKTNKVKIKCNVNFKCQCILSNSEKLDLTTPVLEYL